MAVERPVHYSESVVDVTMRWARWPEDFRHGNYFTVKPATVYNEIELVVRINVLVIQSVDRSTNVLLLVCEIQYEQILRNIRFHSDSCNCVIFVSRK